MQYFKKGCAVVAKNLMCFVCRINVVIFQLIINEPIVNPTKAILKAPTFPKYSGSNIKESAPYGLRK